MDGWIKLELGNSNEKIVMEPKDKKISYGEMILCVVQSHL